MQGMLRCVAWLSWALLVELEKKRMRSARWALRFSEEACTYYIGVSVTRKLPDVGVRILAYS
jgi:hypothetical protein